MIKADKDSLLWYIEELLLSEKDIVVLSDDNGIINLEVKGRSFSLFIKSLTYAGNPYPSNTTRAQLPRREEFQAIKESKAIFLFLGYDEVNEVFACWEPIKTKARLNEKQYVSFFSRLYLQKIAKEQDFVKASLQNDLKYVLFRLELLPTFIFRINDFFPDLAFSGLTTDSETPKGKLLDVEDDDSVKTYLEELYENNTNDSILFLVSSCIKKFGDSYHNMTLRDWQMLVSEYNEKRQISGSDDDEIEEKISDLLDVESKGFLENDDTSSLSGEILEQEVFPESNEGFRNYINKILSYPNLSSDETKELFERYYDGDRNAFDLLVDSNLKVVITIACQFKNRGVPLEDLIQIGNIGLINAIKHFIYKRGTKFNKYIRYGIYAFISDSVLDLPYLLNLPARIVNEHIKYRRLFDKFERQNEYPPSIYNIDLGEDVGIKRKIFLSQLPQDFRDTICFVDDYESFEDSTKMPDNGLMEESTRIYVQGLLSFLPTREKQILQASYGLNGTTPETLEQIGQKYGLTRERVRQIKEKSIRKLQIFVGVRKKEKEETGYKLYSKKEKKQQSIKLSEEQIEHRVNIFSQTNTIKQHYFPQMSVENERERGTSYYSEYMSMREQAQTQQEQRINLNNHEHASPQNQTQNQQKPRLKSPQTLKSCILLILQKNYGSFSLNEIVSRMNQMYMVVRPESVKTILQSMSEVECTSDGRYQLKREVNVIPQKEKRTEETDLPIKVQSNRTGTFTFKSSTPLLQLVSRKILTPKENKRCRNKGLYTIGDVKRIIETYHLTRESTRFTQYTINLWFKIVGLLGTDIPEKIEEKPKEVQQNQQPINFEETCYEKYSKIFLEIRQAVVDGKEIIAKPVLLLAVIDGISEGRYGKNHIYLNEWLDIRYKALMYKYGNQKLSTEINMPFWHMKNDGFWHLQFVESQKEKRFTPSKNWLRRNVKYAYFDEALWILLENKEWRTKMRDFIVEHKLNPKV